MAHIGKFVKVAAGIMNTHSHNADARMEVLASNALRAGADGDTARAVLNCNTTDEALDVLHEKQLLQPTMEEIMKKSSFIWTTVPMNRSSLGQWFLTMYTAILARRKMQKS